MLRTGLALKEIESFLGTVEHESPLVENYLAQYLAVAFYSEMEERVKAVYQDRIQGSGDVRIANFILKTQDAMLGRVRKSDIKEMAKCFGDDCRDRFNAALSEELVQKYQNVILNRHETSHTTGSSVTIDDVKVAVEAAETILDALNLAIQ